MLYSFFNPQRSTLALKAFEALNYPQKISGNSPARAPGICISSVKVFKHLYPFKSSHSAVYKLQLPISPHSQAAGWPGSWRFGFIWDFCHLKKYFIFILWEFHTRTQCVMIIFIPHFSPFNPSWNPPTWLPLGSESSSSPSPLFFLPSS